VKVTLTNKTASEITVKLPDGGRIPASASASFLDITNELLEHALIDGLAALIQAGSVSMEISADGGGDGGDRIFSRTFTVAHGDFTAAAGNETLEDDEEFPEGARLVGYYQNLTAEFAGGTISAAVVDVGISASETDTLTDGTNVFTAAGTGESFGSGTNAKPTQPQDLGGKKLRVKLTTTGDNVVNATAGGLSVTALYAVI